jgi:phage repressor protein C with HTH and peptisase S24 domain
MELDPIRVRLLSLLKKTGSNMKTASLGIGKNPAYLHQFIYRGTPKVFPEDVREALAKYLGVEDSLLRHPQIPPRRSPSDAAQREDEEDGAQPRRRSGLAEIHEIDVRASAGPGAVHDGIEDSKERWFFPESVVRHELRARPDDLRMITIDGDSMEPLLASGDRILVDTSQRTPVPPGIFVIWDGLGLVAKRAEHIPNSDPPRIIIKSVNPEYPTYERDAEEVNMVGRVIWAARRI